MYEYRAKVIRVLDADTVEFAIDLGFNISIREKIRFARINAWEVTGVQKVKGLAAKAYVESVLAGVNGDVVLRTSKDDKYGRMLGEVLVVKADGGMMNLNEELVNLGHAEWYRG